MNKKLIWYLFIRTLVFLARLIPWLNLITVWLFLIGYMDYKQGCDMAAKTYVVSKYWQGPIAVEDNFGA